MINHHKTIVIVIVLIVSLISCSSDPIAPSVKLEKDPKKKTLGINCALVFNDKLKNMVYRTVVVGRCRFIIPSHIGTKHGRIYIKNEIGETLLEYFSIGLLQIFDNVDIYPHRDLIKNRNRYDCIAIADAKIKTSYDKKYAANRPYYNKKSISPELYNIPAKANVTMELNVIDPITLSKIRKFKSEYLSEGSVKGTYCSYKHYEEKDMSLSYSKLIGRAMSGSFTNLVSEVRSELAQFSKSRIELKAFPANLKIVLKYHDDNSFEPNRTIDAGELSHIIATITNHGKGTAFDVKLNIDSDFSGIQFQKSLIVGDMKPGDSKKAIVNLKANLNVIEGTAAFRMQAKEKRGYDSKFYKLAIPTARLIKPHLTVENYKLNDGKTGLASGNGNGIPENGETIEIIPYIRNEGVGSAIKVALKIDSINAGIDLKRQSTTIPKIMPGETVTGNLAFHIPRTYSGNDINMTLLASDIRGASDAKRLFSVNMQTKAPILAYTYKIIDRNSNGFLENGEDGEIEIIPSNNGSLDAKDISVALTCNNLVFSKETSAIDRIDAGSQYVPLRFPFKVPRTIEKESLDVNVRIDQEDFAGISDQIHIPIKLVIPEFQITHQILDPNNNGVIEQGEAVDLIVKVRNAGELDAEDVKLKLNVGQEGKLQPGVFLQSSNEISIGRIASHQKSEPQYFKLHVQRRVNPGDLPIQFTITQQDFTEKEIHLALKIEAEKPEVITIAGQKQKQKIRPTATTSYNTPPMIVVAFPRNNKHVASETEILIGTVVDDRGVSGVDFFLNGRRLDVGRDISIIPNQNPKEREFRIRIPLTIGRNKIRVTAYDIENLKSSKTINVFREKQRGQIWAAVIGLNQYQNDKIPSLKYARNDAEAFAGYLKSHMGLDREHLFEIYDSRATLQNMKSILGTQLRKKTSNIDTVYIFFAGHGAPEEDPDSKDGDGITKYILPYDSDPEDLYSTALPMDEVAKIFNRIHAERLVFILDSCYSGDSGGRTILSAGKRSNLSEIFLDRIAEGKGRIILTSSRANEISQESDTLGHGYFTHCLLEGLRGEADVSRDGFIDIDEIYLYLNKRVPEMTNGVQHPVKKGEAEGQVIVGRVR